MICDIRRRIDEFLTGLMAEALRAVDYRSPPYGCPSAPLAEAVRGEVQVGHICGNPDANYLLRAFGDVLQMQIQLNVYRLVIVYSIPARGALDCSALQPRFTRWEIGANHAGWRIGWRDTVDVDNAVARRVEVYCYAMLPEDFLQCERHQLYWMNDVVQMTRALLLESRRIDVRLSPD